MQERRNKEKRLVSGYSPLLNATLTEEKKGEKRDTGENHVSKLLRSFILLTGD